MPITDTFVLPDDVLLIPAPELPAGVRDKLAYKESDVAITRPHIRAPSKIVGAAAAALLRQFQNPKTIVAAVLDYSRETSNDPERVLEQALPFLKNLIDARVLLEADSAATERIEPTLAPGDRVSNFDVVAAVHIVEDTEVYQARHVGADSFVALKIARLRNGVDLGAAFARERSILTHLDGSGAPRLVDSGLCGDRPYLAMEWIYGAAVPAIAAELHQAIAAARDENEAAELRQRLRDLAVRIADAYASLHERGVLHSDVHVNNLLVDDAGAVKIIDFGYARLMDDADPLSAAPRAGVGFYFEPEYAGAILAGRAHVPTTPAGEQYSVGVIVYQLLTGASHLDFSLKYDEMLRQIAESDPRPWSAHDVAPWPELEAVVMTALSRDPGRRFPSMRAMADALRSASSAESKPPTRDSGVPQSDRMPHAASVAPAHAAFIDRVLERIQPTGELFRASIGPGTSLPTASADHGAAGIGYAALRLACRRGDPELLALADVWITKVLAEATTDSAFYNDALEITRETVSGISFHHMPPGVYFVRALVSHAMADPVGAQRAVDMFVALASADAENLDLTLGRASVLHGATLLLDALGDGRYANTAALEALGDDLVKAIWTRLDTFGPIASSGELTYLGVAHGWAGLMYSTLRWCEVKAKRTGADVRSIVPATLTGRLQELARCARPVGRGIMWAWFNTPPTPELPAPAFMPGWCNGNAGHVFLWTIADRVLGDPSYRDLARRAAWGMIEQPSAFNNLCCGATGCAYALLNLYRHTNDRSWLAHARRYADRVATVPDPPPEHPTDVNSLYKGEIGMMVLLDDLADPERARMPLFE